ncbi:hypothetical protein [Natronosalvus rutilus]|uniref:DUF8001 domain-containing protein n=1 Tax=Natronosalvus rutilus TaxID=2953753 RepID=A0A9E7N9R2_9EURY|nr:hypothetical protein [Natronosalvus rutilus]UTF54045.1 hypothetical protein NGM29_01790 [Natronosalvus rutilus]
MTTPLRIAAGEHPSETILEALRDGRRVVITTRALGESHDVTLRVVDGTYYCDTPTRLHRHETLEEMRACIRKMGYAKSNATDSADSSGDTESADSDSSDGD